MRKLIFFLSLLILASGPLMAKDNRTRLALTVGYNISDVTNDFGRGSSKNSLYGGLLVRWKWTDHINLQPGLLFMPKGYDSYQLANNGAHFDYKIRAYYLEIPITMEFSIPLHPHCKLLIDPGLYYSYGMFGKIKMDMIRWERKCDIFGRERDLEQWMRNDMGWQVGVGLELWNRITLRAHYEKGFIRIVTNDDLRRRNTMFGFSLGYYLF